MKMKAQGAIEYLFMIAAALVIILIVVRQLRGKSTNAGKSADMSSLQSRAQMIAQKYNGTSAWTAKDTTYYNGCMSGNATACNNLINAFPNG